MNQRIRRILATLTLTTAAATGYALTDNPIAQPTGDSTWGAPDTSTTSVEPTEGGTDDTPVIPFDSTWG